MSASLGSLGPIRARLFCMAITLAVLGLVDTSSAQSWPDELRHGPFHYHADFELRPFHDLLRSTSELKDEVPRTLGLGEVQEPIHVFLFHRQSTFQGYVRRFFPSVPARPALFIKQKGPGMVFAHLGRDIAIDLRHETTHAVLHSILPMVPLWLDEGLGEYFEMAREDRFAEHPHLRSIRSQVRWGRVPQMKKLELLGDLEEMKPQHYRDAWSWTHFMLHGPPKAKTTLTAYLRDIQAQVPPGQLSLRLQRQVPQLRRAYLDHFRRIRSSTEARRGTHQLLK